MYTLLIIDDEPNILEGVKRLLNWEDLGISRIFTAGTSLEVMSHIIDWKPDICLVDVKIGSDMGYELIGCLSGLGIHSNYIMMSGYDDFEYAREAMRCGVLDYLLKPVAAGELEACIRKAIVEQLHGTLPEAKQKNRDPILKVEYEAMSPLIHKIVLMVAAEYAGHVSLKEIADKFRMNSTYLGQIFIKETRMKFSEYLACYRLYIARGRIINSDEKIAAIAVSVGYTNMNYFYQQFNQYYHTTPSEMRIRGTERN